METTSASESPPNPRAPVGLCMSEVRQDDRPATGEAGCSISRSGSGVREVNLCRSCGEDFGSVEAFDTHRVGTHAYSYSEGAVMLPPREDGRRCLSVREIETLGRSDGSTVFARNARGVWSLARSLEAASRVSARGKAARAPGRSPVPAASLRARGLP